MRIRPALLLLLLCFFLRADDIKGQCCSYTLLMQDSYGDSWNGGYLEIFRNNTSLGNFLGIWLWQLGDDRGV
ncbi:MAG: hypothetical protein IPN60_20375 [Saprospiraceae bacterium]|nr:hypothetical protein [Candidatus Opimibacter skivensis]